MRRIKSITGKYVIFYKVDLLDKSSLEGVFEKVLIDKLAGFCGFGYAVLIPLISKHVEC